MKDKKLVSVDSGIAKTLGIEIGTAGPATLATEFTVVGSVGFDDTKVARIAVRVSGTVRQVDKSIGDKVAAGDVLAVIHSRDIADAKAMYLAAKDKLALAEKTLRRQQELVRGGGGTEKDILLAQRELNQAQIDLRNATQALLTLGLSRADLDKLDVEHADLARYEIVSPFAGEVLEKQIFTGELLPANRDVFVVADLDVVWVNLRIGPELLAEAQVGKPVEIVSSTGLKAQAPITYLAPMISEGTRSVRARVDLVNPEHRWRPGMVVDARIPGPSAAVAIAVPNDAVQVVGGKPSVFVAVKSGFRLREVKVGRTDGKSTEIVKGLTAGEKIATGETFALKSQLENTGDDND
ncbi:MAG: efflux RND transporter periplasmic adaptor subunit [Reyranella sp.]|uniref:efflux RND transporter periplasmic adaptor subunit n=1 Tax=Reyranella sp. TaxID=1929291 RepID=UPI001AC5FA32|nr:efflux RND transporter periplasmic adaptor subunit [Reyranella sp.]MBN9086301.1 efflux RND transporter periplasmic adaptor subunit [Reyranella sp.]